MTHERRIGPGSDVLRLDVSRSDVLATWRDDDLELYHNADALELWITQVRAVDLPHLHAFTRGLERDLDAVIAAFTLRYSNGPTEGVNTRTKRIARQMHGRAGFALLRHHILLG